MNTWALAAVGVEDQCRNLRQRNVSHEVVRVRKTRCVISRDTIQISEKSLVSYCTWEILSALYFLDLIFGRPEVQPEGKWQWGDCWHCQQLLRAVCAPETFGGHSCNQTWGQGMCLQTRIICVCMHRGMQPVLGWLTVGAAAVLAPCVCWALQIHTEILLLLHCFLQQPNWSDKSISVPALGVRRAKLWDMICIYLFI